MYFTDEELKSCSASKGDLLVCEGGAGYGRSAIWEEDYDICLQNHIHRLRPVITGLCEYVMYFMFLLKETNQLASVGTAMPGLSANRLKGLLLPLPPLREQIKIIEIINKVIPLVNKYGQAQSTLDTLNYELREKIQKSVLQEAIQGRLVPQIANDEPASALLDRISIEKQRMLKEGKLQKRDIVDSVIFKGEDNKYYETIAGTNTEIELPFVFPDTWVVVRLQHICTLLDGYKRSGDGICIDARFLRGKSAGEHIKSGRYVNKGDNIILVDGENSGEVFSVPIDGYMGSTFKQLWISESLYIPYVLECIRYYKDELKNSKKGAAIPHLNKDIFRNLIIGVPPIKEQRRIVDSIQDIYKNLQG